MKENPLQRVWDDVYYTRNYLGTITTAKLDQGQLLRPELGAISLGAYVPDPYAPKYRGLSTSHLSVETIQESFPEHLNVFLVKRIDISNEYLLYCQPFYYVTESGRFICDNTDEREFVIRAEFFRENVLLYTEHPIMRATLYRFMADQFDGVSIVGENNFVNVQIEKMNCISHRDGFIRYKKKQEI